MDPNSCKHNGDCGACNLRNVEYQEQLCLKKEQITSHFSDLKDKITTGILEKLEIIPAKSLNFYRNKMEFTFGICDESPVIGFNRKQKYNEIIDLTDCLMQSPKTNIILQIFRDWIKKNAISIYNKKTRQGLLRFLIIRHSKTNDNFLINLVATENLDVSEVLQNLREKLDLKSFFVSITKNISDTAFSDEKYCVFGEDFIEEKIGDARYKIGVYSFFQVNLEQIREVYKIIENWLESEEILLDLYCGVGGFSLYFSRFFEKTIGIEINHEAIKLANENKVLNNAINCEFFLGDVEEVLGEDLLDLTKKTCMIVDPPRTGLGKATIKKIFAILPDKLIYVSCNTKTMAEDFKLLLSGYDCLDIRAVDMFPNTVHVEAIAFLIRKPAINVLSTKKFTNIPSCMNLLNLAEFDADESWKTLRANNGFYKFIAKISNENHENLNIKKIFLSDNILLKFDFLDGEYKHISRFFNGLFGAGLFVLKSEITGEVFKFKFAFHRNENNEIQGVIKLRGKNGKS